MTSPLLGVALRSCPMGDRSRDSSGTKLSGFDFLCHTRPSTDGYNRDQHALLSRESELTLRRLLSNSAGSHVNVTRWLQREVNQLRAQAPMSQFCSVSGFRFTLHSSSSSTSPWLLRQTTSLLRWPTPHGTEHWGGRVQEERDDRVQIVNQY